ncbi:hypothetical protein Nepgr_005095 [Nepenthes gracilis]|uniref:HVA22-like protein n=1 Tax=Nepenthes gracilis TaxID=150966 RepID=A0AAD3XG75_NEPGR|nr:hypothetical protein Nepgr_005095 [Nepenthes gracilis]
MSCRGSNRRRDERTSRVPLKQNTKAAPESGGVRPPIDPQRSFRSTFLRRLRSAFGLVPVINGVFFAPTDFSEPLFENYRQKEYKMIGSFITRGLVMIFGYAYPAYECFKTVEKNKPEVEQLRFWCQYWILVAVLTVCERIGDAFISWVPMYSEAKLAFYVYLWYPKTKGTSYVYDSFFRPYVSKHETEIDRNLLELRTRAGDIVVLYWQKAASYGQTRIFEILHYVAAQSTPRPRPTQPQQEASRARRPAAVSNRQTSARAQQQNEEPSSPTSSTSLSQQEGDEEEPSSPVAPSTEAPPAAVLNVLKKMGPQPAPRSSSPSALKKTAHVPGSPNSSALKKTASAPDGSVQPTTEKTALKKTASASEGSIQPTTMEAEDMQIGTVPPSTERENAPSPPQETVMEEAIRVTRGRLRKTRSTAK